MKNLFGWVTEADLIFAIVCLTFLVAFVTLAILLSRGGHSIETTAVLKAIDATRDQLGKVDERIEQDHRFQGQWMRRLLARFGFLEAEDIVRDIKKKLDGDVRKSRGDDDGD